MTRLITCLVLGLMAVLPSLSAQTPTFSINPATINADPGDQFTVDVEASNFMNLISFQYSMKWDSTVLRLDDVTNINTDLPGFRRNLIGTNQGGVLTNLWLDENFDSNSLTDGSVIYTLNFTALAGGTTLIEFTEDFTSYEAITVEEEDVGINIGNNATVTVSGDDGGGGGGGGMNTDPVILTAGNGSGENGTEVCVPVRVRNFSDINKFQFSINFDNSVIQYNRAQAFGIPSLAASDFSTPSTGNVVVNYENTSPVSVGNNTVAFELCYDLVGAANTSSNISFSGTPTTIDVQRSNNNVALNSTQGQINVEEDDDGGGTGGGGGMGNGDNPLTMVIGSAQGEAGDNVCVPLSVVDFVDIVSFQFSIEYDRRLMTYSGVQNINLSGLNGGFGAASNGNIAVNWVEPATEGISVPNNTTIAEICFDLTAAGTSNVNIIGVPTSIEVTDAASNGGNIGLTPNNGQVTITGDGGGGGGTGGGTGGGGISDCASASGFTLVAADVNVPPGDNFCVDIVANDFVDIASIQTSMNWDPTIVQYTGIQNLNLPGLQETNFNAFDTDRGELALSWIEQSTTGLTLTSCEDVLFTVCFTAIGNEGDRTDFEFTNNPITTEVSDANEELVDVNTEPGTIVLGGEPVPNIIFTAADITTEEGLSFCVPVSAQGFSDIGSFRYDLQYDAGLLRFDRVEVTNNILPNFNTNNFTNTNGNVAVNWQGTTGVNVPDNTPIFNVCFTAIGPGSTNVAFANAQVMNGAGSAVSFVGNRANINIASGEPITPVTVDDTFFANTGDVECVEVKTQNFDQIVAFQYGMTWDDALFRYENVNILPAGTAISLQIANFGYNPNQPDVLAVSWMEDNFNGIDIADNEALYEVCFTALGPIGTRSPLVYADAPIPEVIIEVNNEEAEGTFNGGTGTLIIGEDNGNILSFTANVVDASGPDSNDGSITLNVTNCNSTPTYVWSAAAMSTTNVANNLPPGDYTVTVSCDGQSVTQTFTVGAAAAIVISATIEDASCVNFTDGSITLNIAGGNPSPDYTITWSDIGETSNRTRSGLTAGNYTVTVTDNSGGMQMETFTVGGNTTALELQVNSVTNASCSNSNDGGVNIAVSGGTPNTNGPAYDIQWSDFPLVPELQRNDLTPGSYVVTITDANGCSEDEMFNINFENPGVEIDDIVVMPITAAGMDGSISVEVTGGSDGNSFTFAWTGPNGFTADTEDIQNLAAGEYTLVVTDAVNGCTNTVSRTINSPLALNAEITAACFGETTGRIEVTASGGAGENYTYEWTGPNGFTANTRIIDNVPPGEYTVRVTDPETVISEMFTVRQGTEIVVTPSIQNEFGAEGSTNGSITLAVTGGQEEYTFMWSDDIPSTTNVATDLTVGNYSATVTDALGCSVVVNNLIVENVATELSVAAESTNISCVGAADGTIVLSINGGQFPYTITVNGESFTTEMTEVTIRDLDADNYTIGITSNAGGDTINLTETITEPTAVTIDEMGTVVFDLTNLDDCNGGINLELTGGTEPYVVSWTGPGGLDEENTEDLGGICAGDYVATVTDGNLCVTVLDPITVQLFAIDVTATAISNPPCPASATGEIIPAINGGRADYTYNWFDEERNMVSQQRNLTNVPPGTYTLEVTDANERMVTATFNLDPSSDLALTTDVTTNFNGFAASCADATDARLVASANSSAGNITYQWDAPGNPMTAAIEVGAGTYSVTATDADGCTTTAELTVAAPPAIEVDFSVSPITCAGEADAEITAMVTGGVGGNRFQWDNASNSTIPTIFGLAPATYTIQVTDANDCVVTATQEIEPVDPIQINIEVENIQVNQDGSATATATGGTPPYSYMWAGIVTDSVFTTDKEGRYTIIVEDANGCSASEEVEIIFEVDCFSGRPVITPDGDGLNDELIINCITQAENNTLQIFNRWGQLVFEQGNYDNLWMGTNSRGAALPEGGYFWVLEYREPDGSPRQVRGSFSIIVE